MDFETIITIVIVLGVLGTVGSLLFWVGVIYIGYKAAKGYQQQLNGMMNSYSANLANMQQAYGKNIPPEVQQQMFTQYLQAQNQMGQFDRLSQDRQDTFRSGMLSQASSAGLDVTGW